MSQKIVILSPHLDDAVFSCWHQIIKQNTQVITIFAGIPKDKTPSSWDLSLGQTDAKKGMRLRRKENADALRTTKTKILDLNYLDNVYRKSPQSIMEIADKIDSIVPRSATIVAPAGIRKYQRKSHVDHILVRLVALELMKRGRQVKFYADIPYMLPKYILPNWPKHILKKMIEYKLSMKVKIEPVELSRKQQLIKQSACEAYKTQFDYFNAFKKSGAFRWEVIISPQKKSNNHKISNAARKLREKCIKKNFILKLTRTISIFVVVSYLLAAYSVIKTNVVPNKYLVFAIPITCLMILLLVVANFKKKQLSRNKRIGIIIASVIMIIANIYTFSISSGTMSFLNNIQDDGYTYEQYSIIAKSDRHIKLESSSKQAMGIIKTDVNNNLVKAGASKITNVSFKDYDEITSITAALDTKVIDMVVVKNSYLQLLQENYDMFYKSVEVLSTFKIKTKNNTNIIKTDTTKPFVIYISGIDTYGDISTVSRSDVNILAAVNPQTHKILLVNTPRDYYVQLHGTTGVRDKLTHAGIYGIDMSVKTIEDLYGTPINYYLRINFSSLTKIVDVLGGVDVDSDYNFTAGSDSFQQGYNQLNGEQALTFSRERHSFEGGDRTRGENQQRVIEAIITKMNNPSTLVNYQNILSSLKGAFQTNMSSGDMTTLIKGQLNDISKWGVESISVDGTGSHNSTYSMGNMELYVMEPDMTSVNNAKQKIQQYQQSIVGL